MTSSAMCAPRVLFNGDYPSPLLGVNLLLHKQKAKKTDALGVKGAKKEKYVHYGCVFSPASVNLGSI